jgi:hypothetical protein
MTEQQTAIKNAVDGAAATFTVVNVMDWFPPIITLIGSLLTVVWFAIRIYETETVQKLVNRKKVDDAEHK